MIKRVVEYSASWCAPCRAFAPTFKKVSEMEEFKDIIFENVDIDDGDHEIDIEKLQIKSVPTTILLDENNEPIYKLMGNVPKGDLVNLINQSLNDR